MKKSVLLFSLILSLIGTAQQQSTITLLSVNPDPVNAGDTIIVNFNFIAPTGTSTGMDQWYVSSKSQGQIVGMAYQTYYSLPKTINAPADTTYHMKFKTLATHSVGAGTVKTHNSNVLTFTFCCEVVNPNPTGIIEYQGAEVTPTYYDLMGNRISPRAGEVIIEQRGIQRRKIVIQN